MPMFGDKQAIQNMTAFCLRNYRALLKVLICCNIITLVLIFCITYLVFFRPTPQYYAATNSGQLMPLSSK